MIRGIGIFEKQILENNLVNHLYLPYTLLIIDLKGFLCKN